MTTDQVQSAFARAVSDAVKASGRSQRYVAQITQMPLVTLNRKLTGVSPMTVVDLARIADAIGSSVVDLTVKAERVAHEVAA